MTGARVISELRQAGEGQQERAERPQGGHPGDQTSEEAKSDSEEKAPSAGEASKRRKSDVAKAESRGS
jgi:hypothetical protein